jgi:hypothetical protein
VQKPLERDWELSIGPDTVRMIAEKARAISAAVNEDYADGAEHEVELVDQAKDNHHHDGLAEEKEDDLRTEELRELIQDLNVDEAAELIALMFVGRGDFDAGEWSEALAEARLRVNKRTASYLLGNPLLGDWLEDGLEAVVTDR